ncbi:MAG: hypothetical protein CVV49_01575 [Spirochaetae bacterium HGW-Spirochaetae-5]|nr:MAG: hypothetical protein CVV49_01575 [Spirochaetae bacterium HGW-Spirochaetae-5]
MKNRRVMPMLILFLLVIFSGTAMTIDAKKYYHIKSVLSGDDDRGFWDLPGGGGFKKGERLQLWSFDKGDDRKYMITPAGNGWNYISPKNAAFGRLFRGNVDVSDGKVKNGSKVHIWDVKLSKNANQQFKFKSIGGGKYKIYVNQGGGKKILCADKDSDSNGTYVVPWDDNDRPACQWKFIEAGNAGILYGAGASVVNKVEVTGGWDRYIYAWGEHDIPDAERWTAIRTPHKKDSNDMGNFWDIPGAGELTRGAGKALQLWEIEFKFQKSPEIDRRYKFLPLWERSGKVEDIGYYLIESNTGCFIRNTAQVNGGNSGNAVPSGYVYVKSVQSGLSGEQGFWDQPGVPSKYKAGDNLGIWSQDYGIDQQFRFVPAGGGMYYIVSQNGGYVDVSGGNNGDGVNMHIWKPNNSASQKFRLQNLGNGRWKIFTSWGRALCTPRSFSNGSNVHTWGDHQGDWMEWYFIPASDDSVEQNKSSSMNSDLSYHWKINNIGKNRFTFESRSDNKYITASGKASANGSKLIMSSSKSSNSEWEFVIISKGEEKKSTEELVMKRADEINKKVNDLSAEIKKKGYKFSVKATSVINKTIKEITGAFDVQPDPKNAVFMKDDKAPSSLPAAIKRSADMKAFNWRDINMMTPVKNQLQCGSCWAFSGMAVYESVYKIMHGKELDLSEQYVVDCLEGVTAANVKADCGSCSGGNVPFLFRTMVTSGAALESQVPYLGENSFCSNKNADMPYKIKQKGYVSYQIATVKEIKEAICKYGPVYSSLKVTPLFQAYGGGVYDEKVSVSGPRDTNHAIVIVGWDDSKKAWLVRNSWSEGWGENGYVWVEYGCANIGNNVAWIRLD